MAVAKVAEPRHDETVSVEALVDGGRDDLRKHEGSVSRAPSRERGAWFVSRASGVNDAS